MPTCIDGHTSVAEDYCDVCGAPIGNSAPPQTPPEPAAPAAKTCPSCGLPVTGRFCEACGHDLALAETKVAATESGAPVVTQWTAVVTADREFYERVLARGGPDTVEFPSFFPERRIALAHSTTLIGRRNRGHGVEPEIDLGILPVDRGVSTQHAVLRLGASGLTITDLGSTNGTSLNGSDDLLANGEEIALSDGDRIHLGAWTTITLRRGG